MGDRSRQAFGEESHGPRRRGKNMDWIVQFEGQMVVCGVLAKALYGSPDRAWLNSLIENNVFATIPFGGGQADIGSALVCLQAWSEAAEGAIGDAGFS